MHDVTRTHAPTFCFQARCHSSLLYTVRGVSVVGQAGTRCRSQPFPVHRTRPLPQGGRKKAARLRVLAPQVPLSHDGDHFLPSQPPSSQTTSTCDTHTHGPMILTVLIQDRTSHNTLHGRHLSGRDSVEFVFANICLKVECNCCNCWSHTKLSEFHVRNASNCHCC